MFVDRRDFIKALGVGVVLLAVPALATPKRKGRVWIGGAARRWPEYRDDDLHKDMTRQGFKQIDDYTEPPAGAILRFYEKDNLIVEVTTYTDPRTPIRHAYRWYDVEHNYVQKFNIENGSF